jgi:anti-sigma B factor antagonist
MISGAKPDSCRLRIAGELDLSSGQQFGDALAQAQRDGCRQIELDLSEVSFLDSQALGILLSARRRMTGADQEIVLVGVRPSLRKIFDLTGLTRYFEYR